MDTCICCGRQGCEWNHVWTSMGAKKIEEIWSIIPLCPKCHRGNFGTIFPKAKEACERESIKRLIQSGFENLNKYQKPMDNTWINRINYYDNTSRKS